MAAQLSLQHGNCKSQYNGKNSLSVYTKKIANDWQNGDQGQLNNWPDHGCYHNIDSTTLDNRIPKTDPASGNIKHS
jgi:hypothetical protein